MFNWTHISELDCSILRNKYLSWIFSFQDSYYLILTDAVNIAKQSITSNIQRVLYLKMNLRSPFPLK